MKWFWGRLLVTVCWCLTINTQHIKTVMMLFFRFVDVHECGSICFFVGKYKQSIFKDYFHLSYCMSSVLSLFSYCLVVYFFLLTVHIVLIVVARLIQEHKYTHTYCKIYLYFFVGLVSGLSCSFFCLYFCLVFIYPFVSACLYWTRKQKTHKYKVYRL